jgi:hypothetical protein
MSELDGALHEIVRAGFHRTCASRSPAALSPGLTAQQALRSNYAFPSVGNTG